MVLAAAAAATTVAPVAAGAVHRALTHVNHSTHACDKDTAGAAALAGMRLPH